jgi:hypothetical protein
MNGDRAGLTEEEPLSPSEALAVVEDQRDRVNRSLQVNVALVHGSLGVAWLAGFGIWYFAFGHGAGKSLEVPVWVAVVVIGVVNAVALMAGLGQTIRRGRGIEGRSWDAMRMYLWSWPLAYAGVYAADAGLQYQGLPARLAPLLWPGSAACVTGVLCLAGGMFFRDTLQYTLGAWLLIVTAASMFAGVPGNFAVLSLAGGGGYLVAMACYIRISRRARE